MCYFEGEWRKTWKKDMNVNDLHLKSSYSMERSEWMEMIMDGND